MASAQYFPKTPGGDKELVVDEFTCPTGVKRLVESLQPMVERVFRVKFAIGGEEEAFPGNAHSWLKMTGDKTEVEAAKLFVKGLVNQEEQQEISYPETLNCVFCGAGGLFMDCLIRNTSALMVTISQGSMLVSGLMEPVVQAYSLILNLLENYRANHRQSIEAGVEVLGNGLDSCPAFKALLKQWSDRHKWDLLLLPRPVQEILLNVVRESRLVIDVEGSAFTFVEGYREAREAERSALRDFARCTPWDKEGYVQGHTHLESPYLYNGRMIGCPQVLPFHQPQCQTIQEFSGERQHLGERNVGGLKESVAPESSFQVVAPNRGPLQSPEVEDRGYRHGPQELGEEEGPTLSVGSAEEFGLQLNFLTAMGYSEDVVKRVLAKTGPKEVSQILDLVQQEQDKKAEEEQAHILTGHTQSGVGRWGEEEDAAEDPSGETEEDSDEEQSGGNGGQRGAAGVVTGEGESQENATAVGKDDFVLGVLKNAAASCGYPEERVIELYDNLPGLSTGDLLKELQKEAMRGRGKGKEMGRGVGRGAGRHREAHTSPAREHKRGTRGRGRHEKKSHRTSESGDVSSDAISTDSQLPQSPGSNVRGPPKPSYPPGVPPVLNAFSLISGKSEDQPGLVNVTAAAMVTGEQRFLDSLSTPFDLKLTDDPGDLSLRRVIIDGSNVAMSHGLCQFFSCRGIAIAVQFFWNRGHRSVTTFVPMWRQKRHPKVTEQHYLTDLQNLGLLSFTPSREVQGKRINSYDDRFMLHLAQKTDGVIVTNDNLRDLLDESPAWRDIIKKRLLQYTFVGDLFMVPDDPLGRGGPHLKDFLRSQDRSPVPGSHTFAGLGSHFPPPSTPNAQTEVLQYRDRTVGVPPHRGGLHGFEGGRGRGQSRGKDRGGVRTEPVHMSGGKERSAAQTSNLRKQLCQVFKGEDSVVTMVLSCNPSITDTNSLSNIILQVLEERARNI